VVVSTTIVFVTHLLTLTCALKYTTRLVSLINNSLVTRNILTILDSILNTDIAFKVHVIHCSLGAKEVKMGKYLQSKKIGLN
jgi:hypothetical protein